MLIASRSDIQLIILLKQMKSKAEPCLRDYLTIHVPASALMGDRGKKKRQFEEMANPLMNKKLQMNKKNDIAIFYSTLSSRSFGKKKKMQSIPLLSNIKLNQQCKLRVLKDVKKSQYNFIFEKNQPPAGQLKKETTPENHGRMISTSHSNKSLPRNVTSHATRRQSTGSLNVNEVFHKKFEPFSNPNQNYLSNSLMKQRRQKKQQFELSGLKAHIFQQHSPHKNSIYQDQRQNRVYIYE